MVSKADHESLIIWEADTQEDIFLHLNQRGPIRNIYFLKLQFQHTSFKFNQAVIKSF